MRSKRGIAVVVGMAAGVLATAVGGSAAHADGQANGPSGLTYRIETVCATGEMQVSTSDAKVGQPTVTVTIAEMGGTWKNDWSVGGLAYDSISITLDKSIAMDPVGVAVKENGTTVITAGYAAKCGAFIQQQTVAARSAFTPMTPTRILDTRPTSRVNYPGLKPGAGASIPLQITNSKVSVVPATATAVVLNVTAVDAAAPGYVQVFPTGRSVPGASSNLNIERVGQTIPNTVIVPLGQDGFLTFYTEAGTHLIADIAGYFVPAVGAVSAGRYQSVTPKRVLDTRSSVQTGYQGPKPGAGARVKASVAVPGAPSMATVAAVALNVTATEASAPGFVQVAPAGKLIAGQTSSLNLERAGQTIPNLVIVPISASGEVEFYTEQGTNLLADVIGYFTNSAAVPATSGLFVAATPERILDTRSRLGAGGYEAVDGGSVFKDFGGLDSWKPAAVVLNVTATGTSIGGYIQVGNGNPGAMATGAHSNLNMEAGQTIPNAVISPIGRYENALEIYNDGASDLLADFAGWFTG